jgi:CheY-like chemotaxis protein
MVGIESSPLVLRWESDPTPVPRERRHGARVQSTGTVIVHGPFAAARWLHLMGSIVRVDARGSAFALVIELFAVPPEFEHLVHDELLSALECSQFPRIWLVDTAPGRRELVAAAFRATGYDVIEVSSPLEAMGAIDQSRLRLWAVVIADTEIASHADGLRKYLHATYPRVPLIVVGLRMPRPGTARVSGRRAESARSLAES